MALAPGLKLGPYEIESLLGAGGMGEVYRARDSRLQRTVAIKILPAHLSSNPELHARFVQEAKSISSLQHPNICVVHDIGSQDGVDFMVMEYVTGQTLDKVIPTGGLESDLAIKHALQIADALSRAHAAGIVHRDLKPMNVMVDENGVVKVLDFGLAKLAVPASEKNNAEDEASDAATMATLATTPGMIVGTFAYMSPEQAEGKPLDARSDIFSFGSVFYEMLSGKRAFEGQSSAAMLSAVLRDDPKPLTELKRSLPAEIRRIVSRCLRKDPTARFASGAELAQELRGCRELLYPESGTAFTPARIAREVRRPRLLVPLLLAAVLLIAGIGWMIKRSRDARWAREVALPQIFQLADQGKFPDAYALAEKAEKSISGDPSLNKLWPTISYPMTIETTPAGVKVYRRPYTDPNAPWEFAATTPTHAARQPRGMFVWKFEKTGYSTVFRTTTSVVPRYSVAPGEAVQANITLDEIGNTPAGMVRVSPEKYFKTLYIPGYEGMPELALKDYWIDQYEVTNREYKTFMDQGGYQNHAYWRYDFQKDGKPLTWDEAMALFRDSAGQLGPKDWVQGTYPQGQDNYPVAGISWYEAAAYAEFAGKSLPTIYHWNRAAGPFSAAFIVPVSNFGNAGIMPVGSKPDMSPWGNFDMAGNVKEWIFTEADSGRRYVLGGAWDEPNYMFIDPDAQSPFLRTPNIGFRCLKYIEPDSIPKVAFAAMPSPRRDLSKEKPVSDQLFQAYKSLYSYDKLPLDATVEPYGNADDDWTAQKITYNAPYNNERATAYLFLPKKGKPPYQTVLFFPGSNALLLRTFSLYTTSALDGILRSGRAVIYPIYKGTYERGDGMEDDVPNTSTTWRDHVIMWVKDASRALDYAETRTELDHAKIAYYGYSWGSEMGSIIPAVDPRYKVVVLALGGLDFHKSLPEVDTINFAPHITQPTLMLNGKYDFFFPEDSTQEPLFHLLGSKKDQKKHLLFDTSHSIPRNELIKQNLDWLDEYLGPVN